MRMIQSSSNPRIRNLKKILKDRKQNTFVVEGKKLLQEAFAAGLNIQEIFATPELWIREREWLEPLEREGIPILHLTPALLKSVSSMDTPQGVLAVVEKQYLETDLALTGFALLLLSIRDPGNFGAMIRTAEACGAEWIGYSHDCVDPFQPKAVRGSMGSLFRVPLVEIRDAVAFLEEQLHQNIGVYGLAKEGGKSLLDWTPKFPLIVCIGSESHGLPEALPLTEKISIPMKGKVESLNAAVAASVFLYSFYRR